ncbi:hypothetical protein CONPUDRAFT_133877, partial [Coniophora puteana RWD-64-598 SS2]
MVWAPLRSTIPIVRLRLKPPSSCIANAHLYFLRSSPHRKYATHRDTTSSLLSSALDKKQHAAQRDDTVGPFQLGISQAQLAQQQKQKKWSELSTGGKVVRTGQRTSNLIVILLGAGLSAVLVYALTSELFSKNSPTVVYGDACKRIEASPKVATHLHGPLTFHNNPPSAVRPRHRNRHVSSQIAVDSSGREHMLLNFYVEGRDPNSKSATFASMTEDGFWDRFSDITLDDSVDWIKGRGCDAIEASKRVFKYLSGEFVPGPAPAHDKPPETEDKDEKGGFWSFAGVFSGIKSSRTSRQSSSDHSGQFFAEGEVHADLVRNDDGYFVFRYLLIDFPNSESRNTVRVFVEKAPGVRETEPIMRWRSS